MYREGAVRCGFIIIKLQTALPHAVWCSAVQCSMVQCGYAILWAVLVRFLRFVRFMRFDKHP